MRIYTHSNAGNGTYRLLMKSSYLLFVWFLINGQLTQAQIGTVSFRGQLVDAKSEMGIEYANIGIHGTPVGCISRQDGYFDLKIDGQKYQDSSISVSALGYEVKSIQISTLIEDTLNVLSLTPVTYEIEEATITTAKPKLKNYGSRRGGDGLIKGMLHGLEKAYLIPVKKKDISISVLRFCMRSEYDTVVFRVNFYEKVNDAPGPRINNKNYIYSAISDENGWIECDLSEISHRFNSDFYISVELLPDISGPSQIKSNFKAKLGGKGQLYTRNYLDSWEQIKGLGVLINIDYYQYDN